MYYLKCFILYSILGFVFESVVYKVSGSSDMMLSSYLLISSTILLHNSSAAVYPANLIYILAYIIHNLNKKQVTYMTP